MIAQNFIYCSLFASLCFLSEVPSPLKIESSHTLNYDKASHQLIKKSASLYYDLKSVTLSLEYCKEDNRNDLIVDHELGAYALVFRENKEAGKFESIEVTESSEAQDTIKGVQEGDFLFQILPHAASWNLDAGYLGSALEDTDFSSFTTVSEGIKQLFDGIQDHHQATIVISRIEKPITSPCHRKSLYCYSQDDGSLQCNEVEVVYC